MILGCLASCNSNESQNLISSIDFVQILEGNEQEAKYYYENNWKVLRDKAIRSGYIHSYDFLLTPRSEEAPFDIILITTYSDNEQYALREENFTLLIEERGDLRLLNEKEPGEFRKVIFGKDDVRHIR